ncbi:glycosyltransferase [Crocosphaera sp.]|uniref:glycosyltransferase n=1 Tax=Crocosphaera sp. TaxID=2729996 RepID=UPI003F1F69D1|nr:glycosyltransferase [Crocosphaera sp.]
MKIAFLLGQFPTLSETFILNQITGLIDRGHQVDIYASKPKKNSTIHPDVEKYKLLEKTYYDNQPKQKSVAYKNGFQLVFTHFLANPVKGLPILIKILKFVKPGKSSELLEIFYSAASCLPINENYDIIHCHFGIIGIKGMILKDLGAITSQKFLVSFYGLDVTMLPQMKGHDVYKALFKKVDLVLGLTTLMNKQLIELGASPEKLKKLPTTSVNLTNYKFNPSILSENEPIKLLTVARLVEKKGLEYSIKAVSKVIKDNPDRRINYRIIGKGSLRKNLVQLIEQLGVSPQIQLLGGMSQTEVKKVYNDSHIFILSSITASNGDQEGLPTVLQEAQAIGLPILSTLHSGIPETIVDGKSGFLVPEKDVDALTQKLDYLVKNPQVWPEMGMQGRKFVETNYNMDKVMDQLVEIYEQILS